MPVQSLLCGGPALASGRALGVWAVGGTSRVGVQWQAAVAQIDPMEPHWHHGVMQVQEELHLLHAAVPVQLLPCGGPAVASGRPMVARAGLAQALGVSAVGGTGPVGVQWQAAVAQRSLHQRPGALLLQVVRRIRWAAEQRLALRVEGVMMLNL